MGEANLLKDQGGHLDDRTLTRLTLRSAKQAVPVAEKDKFAQAHLESCEQCQQRARALEAAAMNLRSLGAMDAERGPKCPSEGSWQDLAAGLIDGAEAETLFEHLAGCAYCGKLLREATEVLAMPFTEEEKALVNSLASSQPAWQRQAAQRLTSSVAGGTGQEAPAVPRTVAEDDAKQRVIAFPPRRPRLRSPWMWAAAAMLAVVLSGWWWLPLATRRTADVLLATAYTDHRTMEFRFTGADHARNMETRGAADRRPAALSAAAALAGWRLSANRDDLHWIAIQGRVDLLEGRYDDAVKEFERVKEDDPDSPRLLVDLATAYFQRAETKDDRKEDYGQSFELLSKVLTAHPNDLVARFNRAIIAEKIFLFDQAVEDWEAYLKADAKSAWADEARQRLSALRQKLEEHRQRTPKLDPKPDAFLRDPHPELRDEEYLDLAVRDWLPAAFPVQGEGDPQAREALHRLSAEMVERHRDYWLQDLLGAKPSPVFGRAVAELAAAAQATSAGEPDRARLHADAATDFFGNTRSRPGTVYAQLQVLLAWDRSLRGRECQAVAEALGRQPMLPRYAWIATQWRIEQASCWDMAGNADRAEAALKRAVAAALDASFGQARLRALASSAMRRRDRGDLSGAWSADLMGLATFWAGLYPPVRAYQLYGDLTYCAEHDSLIHVAYATSEAAVAQVALAPNHSVEAMARHRAAIMAIQAGELSEAEQELRRSDAFFQAFSQNSVMRTYHADGEIDLARIEIETGRLQSAKHRLEAVRQDLPNVSQQGPPQRFFGAMAMLADKDGRHQDAENYWQAEIAISERWLRTLASEIDRASWSRESGNAYRSLAQSRWQHYSDEAGALQVWEWYRAAVLRASSGYAELASMKDQAGVERVAAVGSLPDIRSRLDALQGSTLVSYVFLEQGVAAWTAGQQGVSAIWMERPANRIPAMARRFTELCADPRSDLASLRHLGRQLYDLLIAPLGLKFPLKGSLLIEADGELEHLPMQALVAPDGGYFGDQASILYSPGVFFNRNHSALRPLSAPERPLVVGLSEGDPGVSITPIPDAEREADSVARRFPAAIVLKGPEATVDAVLRELPLADAFLFAGHSLATRWGAGLLLAPSGMSPLPPLLTARELVPVRLKKCRLVVLSACSTHGGSGGSFADPESLVRTLIADGVPLVLASRWDVDSEATEAFMDGFYRSLLAGVHGATALQRSASVLRSGKDSTHPYYWAAFSAFGAAPDL
jgi:CHAT domain-containing protein